MKDFCFFFFKKDGLSPCPVPIKTLSHGLAKAHAVAGVKPRHDEDLTFLTSCCGRGGIAARSARRPWAAIAMFPPGPNAVTLLSKSCIHGACYVGNHMEFPAMGAVLFRIRAWLARKLYDANPDVLHDLDRDVLPDFSGKVPSGNLFPPLSSEGLHNEPHHA